LIEPFWIIKNVPSEPTTCNNECQIFSCCKEEVYQCTSEWWRSSLSYSSWKAHFRCIVWSFHTRYRLWFHFLGLSFLQVWQSRVFFLLDVSKCLPENISWTPSKPRLHTISHEKWWEDSQIHIFYISSRSFSCYRKGLFCCPSTHYFRSGYVSTHPSITVDSHSYFFLYYSIDSYKGSLIFLRHFRKQSILIYCHSWDNSSSLLAESIWDWIVFCFFLQPWSTTIFSWGPP